jgi:hypothetical protein
MEKALALLEVAAAGSVEAADEVYRLLGRLLPGDTSAEDARNVLFIAGRLGYLALEDLAGALAALARAGVVPEGSSVDNLPAARALRTAEQAEDQA